MNPNASTFVPSIKLDIVEQRKYEQQHFIQQIITTKKELAEMNAQLIALHAALSQSYGALFDKDKYSAEQIESLHTKYTQQSQIYYKEYSRFNDLTSVLVSLQQKLHRLLLANHSQQSTPSHCFPSQGVMKGDNLEDTNSCSSPSFTVLPPIMESDAESQVWNDYETKDETETNSVVSLDKKEHETDKKEEEICENTINIMLDNIWNQDIDSICNQFREFIMPHSINEKSIEMVINCIIIHAVNNKPVFFGTKYSILSQSIISYLKHKMHETDLYELLWCCCYQTFRKLQFGNNSEKFINIMIIIAELFNAHLLTSRHIFEYIFKSILCKNNAEEVCENDIEGIYEIFKRCEPSFTKTCNKNALNKYFLIMDNIKTWRKFQNGINRVPFMINEMRTIYNNHQ